jgi:hypothetical protein
MVQIELIPNLSHCIETTGLVSIKPTQGNCLALRVEYRWYPKVLYTRKGLLFQRIHYALGFVKALRREGNPILSATERHYSLYNSMFCAHFTIWRIR